MAQASTFLLSPQPRARWMRFDTAQLLKRFFFCERSLLVSMAAWIPAIAPLEIKTGLARFIWQSAENAHALRNRVFELRFPSRLVEEEGTDTALIELFGAVKDSPSVPAFLLSVGKILLPALRDCYQAYLEASDSIADGPTHRFLSLALSEKVEQIRVFEGWAESALSGNPELREGALAWTEAVGNRLSDVGGVGGAPSASAPAAGPLSGSKTYTIPAHPARDPRFWPCRFYWPDIIDPNYLLGMLYFFETKNIRHKPARAQLFHTYGDTLSEHDMDFDWADETMHAGYGKHWLKELLVARGHGPAAYDQVRERCEKLVSDYVSTATTEEAAEIKKVAPGLMNKAARR